MLLKTAARVLSHIALLILVGVLIVSIAPSGSLTISYAFADSDDSDDDDGDDGGGDDDGGDDSDSGDDGGGGGSQDSGSGGRSESGGRSGGDNRSGDGGNRSGGAERSDGPGSGPQGAERSGNGFWGGVRSLFRRRNSDESDGRPIDLRQFGGDAAPDGGPLSTREEREAIRRGWN